ncbi:hypothetical protein [Streptomyces sp. NPDC058548]|uniref:scabin-related ADP-ribosyltransferase n=1 Tax=Streptomyces sp. NPDC058548 TaxID=3346545 RepID=UPI003661FD44
MAETGVPGPSRLAPVAEVPEIEEGAETTEVALVTEVTGVPTTVSSGLLPSTHPADGLGHAVLYDIPDLMPVVEQARGTLFRELDDDHAELVMTRLRAGLATRQGTKAAIEPMASGVFRIVVPYRGDASTALAVVTARIDLTNARHTGDADTLHVFEGKNVRKDEVSFATSHSWSHNINAGWNYGYNPHDATPPIVVDGGGGVGFSGTYGQGRSLSSSLGQTRSAGMLHVDKNPALVAYDVRVTISLDAYWGATASTAVVGPMLSLVGRHTRHTLVETDLPGALTLAHPQQLMQPPTPTASGSRPTARTTAAHEVRDRTGLRPEPAHLTESFIGTIGGLRELLAQAENLLDDNVASALGSNSWHGARAHVASRLAVVFSMAWLHQRAVHLVSGGTIRVSLTAPGMFVNERLTLVLSLDHENLGRTSTHGEGKGTITGTIVKDFRRSHRSVGGAVDAALGLRGSAALRSGFATEGPDVLRPGVTADAGRTRGTGQRGGGLTSMLESGDKSAGTWGAELADADQRKYVHLSVGRAHWNIALERENGTAVGIRTTVEQNALTFFAPEERAAQLLALEPTTITEPLVGSEPPAGGFRQLMPGRWLRSPDSDSDGDSDTASNADQERRTTPAATEVSLPAAETLFDLRTGVHEEAAPQVGTRNLIQDTDGGAQLAPAPWAGDQVRLLLFDAADADLMLTGPAGMAEQYAFDQAAVRVAELLEGAGHALPEAFVLVGEGPGRQELAHYLADLTRVPVWLASTPSTLVAGPDGIARVRTEPDAEWVRADPPQPVALGEQDPDLDVVESELARLSFRGEAWQDEDGPASDHGLEAGDADGDAVGFGVFRPPTKDGVVDFALRTIGEHALDRQPRASKAKAELEQAQEAPQPSLEAEGLTNVQLTPDRLTALREKVREALSQDPLWEQVSAERQDAAVDLVTHEHWSHGLAAAANLADQLRHEEVLRTSLSDPTLLRTGLETAYELIEQHYAGWSTLNLSETERHQKLMRIADDLHESGNSPNAAVDRARSWDAEHPGSLTPETFQVQVLDTAVPHAKAFAFFAGDDPANHPDRWANHNPDGRGVVYQVSSKDPETGLRKIRDKKLQQWRGPTAYIEVHAGPQSFSPATYEHGTVRVPPETITNLLRRMSEFTQFVGSWRAQGIEPNIVIMGCEAGKQTVLPTLVAQAVADALNSPKTYAAPYQVSVSPSGLISVLTDDPDVADHPFAQFSAASPGRKQVFVGSPLFSGAISLDGPGNSRMRFPFVPDDMLAGLVEGRTPRGRPFIVHAKGFGPHVRVYEPATDNYSEDIDEKLLARWIRETPDVYGQLYVEGQPVLLLWDNAGMGDVAEVAPEGADNAGDVLAWTPSMAERLVPELNAPVFGPWGRIHQGRHNARMEPVIAVDFPGDVVRTRNVDWRPWKVFLPAGDGWVAPQPSPVPTTASSTEAPPQGPPPLDPDSAGWLQSRNVHLYENTAPLTTGFIPLPGPRTAHRQYNPWSAYASLAEVDFTTIQANADGTAAPRYRYDDSLLFLDLATYDPNVLSHLFANGLQAPHEGPRPDLQSYLLGLDATGYVATTRSDTIRDVPQGAGVRLLVDAPGGFDVSATFPGMASVRYENTVLHPDSIAPQFIVGAEIVNGAELDSVTGRYTTPVTFVPNPQYWPTHRPAITIAALPAGSVFDEQRRLRDTEPDVFAETWAEAGRILENLFPDGPAATTQRAWAQPWVAHALHTYRAHGPDIAEEVAARLKGRLGIVK